MKLCATTRTAFLEQASIENVLDGLLARFIFTTGHAAPRRMQRTTEQLKITRQRVLEHARAFHDRAAEIQRIDIPDDVLDLAWALEQRFKADASAALRPDAAGASMKRLADAILRVAALLAIDRTSDTVVVITPADFEVATRMGERWKATTLEIVNALGRTRFQADCEAVLATVDAHPKGIALSTLYRAHRRLRKRDFDEILGALGMQQRLKRVGAKIDGPGRHPVIIFPWASAPKGA